MSTVAWSPPHALPAPAVEIGLAAATGVAHLAWTAAELPRLPFLAAVIGGWGAYLGWRATEPGALRSWGLTRQGLLRATPAPLALTLVASGAMLAWGEWTDAGPMPAHLVFPLVLYPIWGVVQQFLVHGLVTRNLDAVGAPLPVTALVAAGGFAVCHWDDPVLMAATFGLGAAFAPLYLRHRNLLPLGVAHGWLGTLIYDRVLDVDPWLKIVGGA